ncbi:MAG: hypothetical protein BWX84_02499 [Verrucomicrobia bacterium ADurb.Bin118]|nr:MAG: hypothetical protein BWX84_02499 [Verrucomicrobia bacterium ADurb.Bin118]
MAFLPRNRHCRNCWRPPVMPRAGWWANGTSATHVVNSCRCNTGSPIFTVITTARLITSPTSGKGSATGIVTTAPCGRRDTPQICWARKRCGSSTQLPPASRGCCIWPSTRRTGLFKRRRRISASMPLSRRRTAARMPPWWIAWTRPSGVCSPRLKPGPTPPTRWCCFSATTVEFPAWAAAINRGAARSLRCMKAARGFAPPSAGRRGD